MLTRHITRAEKKPAVEPGYGRDRRKDVESGRRSSQPADEERVHGGRRMHPRAFANKGTRIHRKRQTNPVIDLNGWQPPIEPVSVMRPD